MIKYKKLEWLKTLRMQFLKKYNKTHAWKDSKIITYLSDRIFSLGE